MQMYSDAKEEKTATKKLYKLKQMLLAMVYTTKFQSLSVLIKWNKKALMAQYKKGLKLKMLNVLVFVKNPKNMKKLINKVVKINNRIYQHKRANKGHNR